MPRTANSAYCTTCERGVFSPQSSKDGSPLAVTLSLRAPHLTLLELPGALLERFFPCTLFLSEHRY